MSNGDTLDSITAILGGEEPIPDRVSNRLIMIAIAQNYQQLTADISAINKRIDEFIALHLETCVNVDNLDTAMKLQMQRLDDLRESSSRWDKIIAVGAVAGTAIGSIFGQK